MEKNTPNKHNQRALNEEFDALKKELEKQKVRNDLLEQEIIRLKQEHAQLQKADGHRNFDFKMPAPVPSQNLPVAIWEENFSEACKYIQQLNSEEATNLKAHFDQHPDRFDDLLKKIKVHHLNESLVNLSPTKKKVDNLYDMLGPNAKKNVIEVFQAIRDRKRWFNSEVSIISPDGHEQVYIIQFSVLKGHEKDYSRVIVAMTNITDRQATAIKLQETNRQLSTLLGNLNGIAYRCKNDRFWTMLFISDAVIDVTGYSKDEILDNKCISYAQLIHQEDLEHVSKVVNNSIENNQRFALEYRIITKNSEEKWVWEQGIGLREPDGKVRFIEGYIIDITDRKKAEVALSESEEKFKNAFDSSPTMIILSKLEDGTIVETNEAFEKITGWSKKDSIGNSTLELGLWSNPEDRSDYIDTIRKNGFVENKEYDFQTKSGEIRNALVSGHILKLQRSEVVLGVLTDITAQKKYNIELANEKTHLRTLLKTIPELIWLKDPQGKYLNCNYQFEKFYGVKESDIAGKTDYDYFDTESADFFRQKDKEAVLANKPITNLKWVTVASDGHKALLEATKTPMYDSQGQLVGILGISRDVTTIRANEEALKKSENWYRAIFNNTGTATCIINEEKILTLVNDKFQELSGYSKDELENKMKWTDFVIHEDLERMKKYHADRRANQARAPKQYEFTFVDRDKKHHQILLTIDMIPGSKMSVASLLDITARVDAIKQLSESHEKYQNLVENINDVFYELDREWRIKYISPSVKPITGFSPESYIGKSFIDVVEDADKERVFNRFLDFKKNNTVSTIDFRLINNYNKLVWIHISGKPIVQNEEIIGSRGIAVDITKQKEIQNQLIQAKEEAEQADRLKSSFLATMSHELRTPLNAIIGFSQIIEPEMDKEEIMEMVGIINKSGNHLLSIIESIFEIAMLQSKQTRVRPSQFELKSLLKNLKYFAHSELDKTGKKELSSDIQEVDKGKHLLLQTDETKLTQVITNLLSNAIKYSEKGMIKLNYSITDSDITFMVKDEGIGISKETQEIIFERFRQIDDTSTRKHGGVGLGLAICKEISELLNGELWVESDSGKGSTFYFKLPDVVVNN